MKTRIIFFFCLLLLLAGCARGVTPFDAANNNYKKCRGLRGLQCIPFFKHCITDGAIEALPVLRLLIF